MMIGFERNSNSKTYHQNLVSGIYPQIFFDFHTYTSVHGRE